MNTFVSILIILLIFPILYFILTTIMGLMGVGLSAAVYGFIEFCKWLKQKIF